jgi:hypothetical protein
MDIRRHKKHKTAVFLCGSSGAGKTSSLETILKDVKLKSSYAYLNIDTMRDKIKSYKELQETAFHIMKEGYNLVWDKTCRNVKDTTHEISEFKKSGYKTIGVIVYAELDTILARLSKRTEQPISEEIAKGIFNELSRKAEKYMNDPNIDELFLYNNDHTLKLIYFKGKKEVHCLSPNSKFYFNVC